MPQAIRRVHDNQAACENSVAHACNINGIVMLVADAGLEQDGEAVMQWPQDLLQHKLHMCNTLLHLRQIYSRHCNTSVAEVNA